MNFFFDTNVPPSLAEMVRICDKSNRIVHLNEKFPSNTRDIEWIEKVAKWGGQWFVISGDLRILRNEAEKRVLRGSRLTFFAMAKGWTSIDIYEQASKFIKCWPQVLKVAEGVVQPMIFEISINSKITEKGKTASSL